ncbi:MAG TPA: DUF2169 domain-containing protein, partial [Polyangiaceae bacterium]
PNIEDPDDLIRTWESSPRPAGCGFFPRNSRPRADWWGTYDEKWKAERKPELPLDFRFDAYNGADLSLQAAPYLLGNEVIKLTNVMPGGGVVEFGLPGLSARLTLTQDAAVREAAAHLDTVVLLPDEASFCLLWRATCAVTVEDASNVRDVRIAYQSLDPAHRGGAL